MNEIVKSILARFCTNCGFLFPTFPYYRDMAYDLTSCKEIGCRYEIWTDCVVVGLKTVTANEKLISFQKLSLACGIKLKETDLELVTINKGTWLIVRGWWARNVLRRELCRLVIKSGTCNSIEEVRVGFYHNYFSEVGLEKDKLFTSGEFKSWAESIKNFKVDKTIRGSGFFKWYKQGII